MWEPLTGTAPQLMPYAPDRPWRLIMHTPSLESRANALGPWFHNLRLGEEAPIQTAPDHPLGDFPANFWQFFSHAVPDDLSGQSVLDIGCNGGFYSFELKRRGAARVLGVDHDPVYLRQACFARQELGLDVEFVQGDVYDIDRIVGGERFDYRSEEHTSELQ